MIKTFGRGVLREIYETKPSLSQLLGLTSYEQKIFDNKLQTFSLILRRKFSIKRLSALLQCPVFGDSVKSFLTKDKIKKIVSSNEKMSENPLAYEEAARIFQKNELWINNPAK